MKKHATVITVMVLVTLVVLLFIGIADSYSLNKVKDSDYVATLETLDATKYSTIKEELAEALLKNKGMVAEKVVFYIDAPHYAPYYSLDIYYKVDGNWYGTRKNWLSSWISHEVDNEVCNMILS